MSRCSNALAAAIKDLDVSQTDFAQRCNLQLSQINRYVRGASDIGTANLQIIARQLSERHRAKVVAAWLRDHIPDAAWGQVTVIEAEPVTRIAETAIDKSLGDLSPDLESAIYYLAEQACKHTAISDLMIDLARALRGDSA